MRAFLTDYFSLINMRAIGNKVVAFTLREKFGNSVEGLLIDNCHRAHDPEQYHNAAATGAVIAAALV